MDDITIQHGIPTTHIEQAANLYYTAFYTKLQPIFRNDTNGKTVLQRSINGDYAFAAIHQGALVGLAGYKTANGQLLDIQPNVMRDVFGFVGGWTRLLALAILSRELEAETLLMDGIMVDESMRGKGIGSRLLDAIMTYACAQNYQHVRLDVVDTNPRARQLYERKGFIAQKSEHYRWLKPIFGFSGTTTMTRHCQ